MLDIQNISKTFEKGTVNEHVAINNMSLKLEDGEFVTIVGSNGAGKSTMLYVVVLWLIQVIFCLMGKT